MNLASTFSKAMVNHAYITWKEHTVAFLQEINSQNPTVLKYLLEVARTKRRLLKRTKRTLNDKRKSTEDLKNL